MPMRTRLKGLRGFAKARGGATALEFALVAGPLFFMILGIMEMGMVYIVTTSLDTATQEAARQVRTGQLAKQGGATAASFKTLVCSQMSFLQTQCQTNLAIDVRGFASFSGETAPNPVTPTKFDSSQLVFQTGTPGQIMLVRSFYQWKLITPVLWGGLQSIPGTGIDVITSAATFRNEPYS